MSLFTVVTKNNSYQLPATKLIVGLGNPGKEYESTRHNAGFMALDNFIATYRLDGFSEKAQLHSQVSETSLEDTKLILAKPQTLMNRSGQAVFSLQDYYQITTENILVVHDDIDINFGTVRVRETAGDGGHKGVRSISDSIGEMYARIRIGVSNQQRSKVEAESFVLKKFSASERKVLDDIWPIANEFILKFIEGKLTAESKSIES